MVRQPGAVRMTRGERAPHSGQADGSSHSAIARYCVNGPHFLHIYSYVGIDHLHPGKTHPAADQSVAIMETIPVDSWVVNVIGHFLAPPADPLAVRQTIELIRHTFRGCLSNHAPSLTEARWTTPCASFLNGLSSLQCTKQLLTLSDLSASCSLDLSMVCGQVGPARPLGAFQAEQASI
jgi:hypothetical protein